MTSFAVIVLREDLMMADNLIVENSVLLDYCENVSPTGIGGRLQAETDHLPNVAGSPCCVLLDSSKAREGGIRQIRASGCDLLSRRGYIS